MNDYSMQEIATALSAEAEAQGVDPSTVLALFTAENTADGVFKPEKRISLKTTSPAGASGIGQIMPATLAGLKAQGWLDKNTDYGTLDGQIKAMVAAVKQTQKLYNTKDPARTAIGYNASWKANKEYEASARLPSETVDYVDKVAAYLAMDPSTGNKATMSTPTNLATAQQDAMSSLDSAQTSFLDVMKRALGLQSTLLDTQSKQAEEVKQALGDRANAEVAKATALSSGETKKEISARQHLQFFGTNTDQVDSRISKANQDLSVADMMLRELQPQVDEIQKIDPTKNPVGWLLGQLKMASLAPRYNMAEDRKKQAIGTIANLQALTKAQNDLEVPSLIQERNDLLKAEVQANAAKAIIAKHEIDKETRQTMLANISTQVQFAGQTHQLALTKARLMAEAAAEGRANARLDAATAKEAAKIAREQKSLESVNVAAELMGLPHIDTRDELTLLKPDTRERLMMIAGLGGTAYGNSLGEAVDNLNHFGMLPKIAKRNAPQAAFINFAVNEADKLLASNDATLIKKFESVPRGERRQVALNELAIRWKKEYDTNLGDAVTPGNPYGMNARLFASAPELAGNSFAKYAKELLAAQTQVDDKALFKYAADKLRNKEPMDLVVKELADFYRIGLEHQHVTLGTGSLGMNLTNDAGEVTYKVSPNRVLGIGFFETKVGKKEANLLNPADLMYLLTQKVAKDIQAQASSDTFQLPLGFDVLGLSRKQ